MAECYSVGGKYKNGTYIDLFDTADEKRALELFEEYATRPDTEHVIVKHWVNGHDRVVICWPHDLLSESE